MKFQHGERVRLTWLESLCGTVVCYVEHKYVVVRWDRQELPEIYSEEDLEHAS